MHSATKLGLITILITQALLSTLLYLRPDLYDTLSQEDALAENLTAILLAITGVVLLYQPFRLKVKLSKWSMVLLVTVGLGFILAAGEEISWGQRIFGFETPPVLEEINDQDEFNFHNIDKKFFDRILDRLSIVFFFVSLLMLLFKKRKILDFPVPHPYLILTFISMVFYRQDINQILDFYNFFGYLAICILVVHGIRKKDNNLLIMSIGTLLFTFLLTYWHSKFASLFIDHNNSANEYRELFFAFCTIQYAYYIKKVLC